MIGFTEQDHRYFTLDGEDEWTSATTLIHKYTNPFDAQKVSEQVSKKKSSKWYGIPPATIRELWEAENKRATTLGTWYHQQREEFLLDDNTHIVHKPIWKDGVKIAPSQVIKEGIHPEHLMYLNRYKVCGQCDQVIVAGNKFSIRDYKTNKQIDRKSFIDWEGVSKKMLTPLSHLDDCNYNHYALQLSLYAYIILQHNPHLKLTHLTLEHITFMEQGRDKYDYPIHTEPPQVRNIEYIEVPYLKAEIQKLLK